MGRTEICYNICGKQRAFSRGSQQKEEGFAVTALVVFLPILMAAIIFLYIMNTHIEVQSDFNNICRTHLTETQEIIHYELEVLMALNAFVKTAKYIKYAAMILIAIFPEIALLGEEFLAFIKKIESGLGKIQNALVKLMNTTMTVGNKIVLSLISSDFFAYQSSLTTFLNFENFNLKFVNSPTPAIEPENKDDSPTIYHLKKNFEKKQKLFFNWEFKSMMGSIYNSEELKSVNPLRNFNHTIKGGCAVTLSEESPWDPIQVMVRQ